jgi:hypothetical protein
MRDSTGLIAPLRVIAYTVEGVEATPQPLPQFVVLDTGAHLSGALLIGETAGSTVRIVGTVASLQTRPESVKVTLSPDTLVAVDSVNHLSTYDLTTGDTAFTSADLRTRVNHVGATASTPVQAVIVRYTVVKAPMPRDNTLGPTIVLMPGNSTATRDTTDALGLAARAARLRIAALLPSTADTAVIDATASYRGRTIGTVQFIVVFRSQ